MKIAVANKEGIFQALPSLLSSLPGIKAEHFQPFGSYDISIGVKEGKARQILFEPEQEKLEGLRHPVTIGYQEQLPLRIDRVVSNSPPNLLRRYESLIAKVGRLVVEEAIYAETRKLLHPSIPIECGSSVSGLRLILEDGFKAKQEILTAMIQGQPFMAVESDASESIVRGIRCPYPWMIPFNSITDAVSKLELIQVNGNLQSSVGEIRKRCLSERLHSRFLHLWAEVLLG